MRISLAPIRSCKVKFKASREWQKDENISSLLTVLDPFVTTRLGDPTQTLKAACEIR